MVIIVVGKPYLFSSVLCTPATEFIKSKLFQFVVDSNAPYIYNKVLILSFRLIELG